MKTPRFSGKACVLIGRVVITSQQNLVVKINSFLVPLWFQLIVSIQHFVNDGTIWSKIDDKAWHDLGGMAKYLPIKIEYT